MACRGVHFSIDQQVVDRLLACSSDAERLEIIKEDIEEDYFNNQPNRMAETDKAWDWIHRAVTDGNLEWSNGRYPLNHLILGGRLLYQGDDYIISLKTPEQVKHVWQKLSQLTSETFKQEFEKIDESELNGTREEDLAYAWGWLEHLMEFWQRAASEDRYVLFTVDQ